MPDVLAPGRVTLVGAGPGSADLLTLAAVRALRTADVVLVDRLAPQEISGFLGTSARVVDVSKLPAPTAAAQGRISARLIDEARAGHHAVRLKGGDPYVFGYGGDEWLACVAAGVRVEVVPGVSSATAVPAMADIPLTHKGISQGFTVVSGHVAPGDPRSVTDWEALARLGRTGHTLVLLMAARHLDTIAATLIGYGLAAATHAATIQDGGLATQRVVRAALGDIAGAGIRAGIGPPALTIIGPACAVLHGLHATGDDTVGITKKTAREENPT